MNKTSRIFTVFSAAILALLLVSSALCVETYNLTEKTGTTIGQTSTAKMTERIIEAAGNYEEYAPIPRIALVDTCFARDLKEYKALNTYGVVMISALTRDNSELPLKNAYVLIGDKKVQLKKLGSIAVEVKDPLILKVFGPNRVDSYYLIPYNVTLKESKLVIDWARNRDGMPAYEFTGEGTLEFLKGKDTLLSPKKVQIDKKALKAFLASEYGVELSAK